MKIVGIVALLVLFVLTGCFAQKEELVTSEIENTSLSEGVSASQWEMNIEDNWGQDTNEIMEVDVTMTMQETDTEIFEEVTVESWEENIQELAEEAGVYITYSTDMLGKTENTVIFFAASWCPSCVAADKNLSSADIPSWVTILKADYDSALELRQKYSIASQHTFVSVDTQGNQLRKWVGGTTIDDIIEKL